MTFLKKSSCPNDPRWSSSYHNKICPHSPTLSLPLPPSPPPGSQPHPSSWICPGPKGPLLALNEAWDRRELPDQDPVTLAVEAQSLNYCTTSEVPDLFLGICSEVSMVMADLRPEGGCVIAALYSEAPSAAKVRPPPAGSALASGEAPPHLAGCGTAVVWVPGPPSSRSWRMSARCSSCGQERGFWLHPEPSPGPHSTRPTAYTYSGREGS